MGGQPKIALMSETTGHLFATGVYTETFLGGADGLGSEHHLDNGSSTLEITGEDTRPRLASGSGTGIYFWQDLPWENSHPGIPAIVLLISQLRERS